MTVVISGKWEEVEVMAFENRLLFSIQGVLFLI